MKIIDMLREAFQKKGSKIKIRGEISGVNWLEIRMTNTIGQPITLGTSPNEVKMSIQPLYSGAESFSIQSNRIDNSHGFVHQHSGAFQLPYPLVMNTISGALSIALGSEYWTLERNSSIF